MLEIRTDSVGFIRCHPSMIKVLRRVKMWDPTGVRSEMAYMMVI
jgi:hypothetical protein